MSFGDYLKAELKRAWVFLVVFIGIGVALDVLMHQQPVDWVQRVSVAVLVTALYVVFSAWQKQRRDQG
ncbi:MAG: hypothetical protein ACK4GT_21005 [Pararhodobacter sp.]